MRRVSMVLAIAAVAYFGAHLWFVLSGANALDAASRAQLLDEAGVSLAYWALFVLGGIAVAGLALRFDRLNGTTQRAVLFGCAALGAIAGVVLEWWTSLYFVLPAVVLALSHRRIAHA